MTDPVTLAVVRGALEQPDAVVLSGYGADTLFGGFAGPQARADEVLVISPNQPRLKLLDPQHAELALERSAWLVTADPEFSKLGKPLLLYSLPRHGRLARK